MLFRSELTRAPASRPPHETTQKIGPAAHAFPLDVMREEDWRSGSVRSRDVGDGIPLRIMREGCSTRGPPWEHPRRLWVRDVDDVSHALTGVARRRTERRSFLHHDGCPSRRVQRHVEHGAASQHCVDPLPHAGLLGELAEQQHRLIGHPIASSNRHKCRAASAQMQPARENFSGRHVRVLRGKSPCLN